MFSKRLHDLRVERGITQKELADRLSLGRSTVAGYESKGKQPDNARLCLLADFFGVSVDYLLGHTDNRAVIPPVPSDAAPPDPAYLEAVQYLEGLSGEALASALRCLQAIKALDDAKAPADAAVILEKNA